MLRIQSSDGSVVGPEAQEWVDAEVDDGPLMRLLLDVERTREFDRLALRAARHGRLKGYYPCAGQESIVGLAHALAPQDWVFPAYREQGLRLARGVGVAAEVAMFAGANAPWDPLSHRVMPANTAIGSHLPHAAGFARAQALTGSDVVTVAVFGDGAVAEGDFHAAANLAGLWQPPLVLFCQNNQYAQSTPAARQSGSDSIASRGVGYGVTTLVVDGMDPLAVLKASRDALERARRGDGATFIESVCYRFGGHSALDVRRRYRSRAEEAQWRTLDPLLRLRTLVEQRGLAQACRDRVEESLGRVRSEFAAALDDVGRAAPPSRVIVEGWLEPSTRGGDPSCADVDVDAHQGPGALAAANAGVLGRLMAVDERVVVLGEDVRDGGVLGATEGLADRFGDRVMDAPLNECGIVGAAIGMALAGLRPVADIAFAGFALTAFDQLVFHAARYRWRSGGTLTVPLVVRMPAGGGHGGYEGHNESIEGLLTHVPGLVVLAPSTIEDAVGALTAAVGCDQPVVLLESTRAYLDPHATTKAGTVLPLRFASAVVIAGDAAEVTVVTYGSAAAVVRDAVKHLGDTGPSVDLIDLRWLVPWDLEAVLTSVRATGRLLVVHDSPVTGGFGGEIVAAVAESGLPLLVPPRRLAQPDLPHGPALWEPLTEVTIDAVLRAVLAMTEAEAVRPVRR